ncbi:TPA: hypothetical protein WL153_001295 [Neisseria gonorrhoeae]
MAENLSKSAEQIVAELYGSPEDTFTKARMFQTVAAGIRIEFVGPEDDGKDG